MHRPIPEHDGEILHIRRYVGRRLQELEPARTLVRALVVGRFQPLHNGHVATLRAAQAKGDELVVAIGSTQGPPTTRNPFSFEERKAMLQAVFSGLRIADVPDINDPVRWVAHCLAITGPVDVVYGNDDATLDLFEQAHVPVQRPGLVQRESLEGSRIRALMVEGDEAWRKLVPAAVVPLLLKPEVRRRLLAFE